MTNKNLWRQSFDVPGASHGSTPIPSATRVGNMLFSSGLMGADPVTGELSEDAQIQVEQVFVNLDTLLNTAGSCLEEVVHLTVSLTDISLRDHVNREWLQRFPDPNSRPARHTNVKDLRAGMQVQLEVIAVINSAQEFKIINSTITLESEYVHRLRHLDCCAVSDAMDRLGYTGLVGGLPQRSGNRRIAGRVVTVKLGTGLPTAGQAKHLGCTAIESAGPDNVIVVEQKTGVEAGCWGGLLSLGARVRGIAGVVADGPVRDIDEAITYGLPIFSRSLTAATARGRVVEKGTNIPIKVGEVDVHPGDYVIADRSGVVFIPANSIQVVIETAEMIADKESSMSKAILAGVPIGQVMGGDYEHMLDTRNS